MKIKTNICEICGAEEPFNSGVLINFGDGGTADIEVCSDCAERIYEMIFPYSYKCPICGNTVRSGRAIEMECDCTGTPVPLALTEPPKNVLVTWRVYAAAENLIDDLLENEGYYLDEDYIIRDRNTDKMITDQFADLDGVVEWVEAHFPFIDEI